MLFLHTREVIGATHTLENLKLKVGYLAGPETAIFGSGSGGLVSISSSSLLTRQDAPIWVNSSQSRNEKG